MKYEKKEDINNYWVRFPAIEQKKILSKIILRFEIVQYPYNEEYSISESNFILLRGVNYLVCIENLALT